MLNAIVATVMSASTALALPETPTQPAFASALADYFDNIEEFSGVVLITHRGQPVFQLARGEADRESGRPITLDTAFLVGSISKQFTAAGILVLAQEGHVDISDPLSAHLEFVPPDKEAITLHHLLAHTSGLPDAYWDQHRDLGRETYLSSRLETLDLLAEPGSEFQYSNLNYDLLGLVIERASGQGYEEFLDQHVFKPAGLSQTGCSIPEFGSVAMYQDPVIKTWTNQGIEVASPIDRPEYFRPIGSGGLLSTASDLLRWHEQLKTDRVLSEESRKIFQTPGMNNFAYGWRVMDLPDGDLALFHGGYDDSTGVNAIVARVIGADVVVTILSNSIEGGFVASNAAMDCYKIMASENGGG